LIKPDVFKYIYGPLFLVILAAPFGRPNSDNQTEIWIPIISTISVFLISLDILTSKKGIESTRDRFLGKMAYPIYLVHILVIGFVNLLGLVATILTGGNQSVDSDYRNALADIFGYLTLLITWIFAAILVKFVESPLEKVRSRIRGYK
jgi:peptidoglycan/LPS O-acetylase OafA/YrhL